MLEAEAKSFQSKIRVYYTNDKDEDILLEVNKPETIEGWDIYQTDYDKEMGSWSDYSIIEMVHDPWLPVIYVGVAMLILGSVLLMFVGKQD
jgi:cytochrome c biogenesis protein ResB